MTEDPISRALMALNDEFLSFFYSEAYQAAQCRSRSRERTPWRRLKSLVHVLRTRDAEKIRGSFFRFHKEMTRGCDVPLPPANPSLLGAAPVANTSSCERTVIYTCILGGYDKLKEPLYTSPYCDYVAVTDFDIPQPSAWKRHPIERVSCPEALDARMKARYIKTHPHILFPEYRDSVFVDGSVLIVADLLPLFEHLDPAFLGVHTHPDRKDIFEEGKLIAAIGRANAGQVRAQLDAYRSDGFYENLLYETKILVRRHAEEPCVRLMERWWSEMVRHTERDQLSLPYAIWKENVLPLVSVLGTNPNRNPRFRCFLHMGGERK